MLVYVVSSLLVSPINCNLKKNKVFISFIILNQSNFQFPVNKLLYRALIPKAPFSQRSSKFRRAIFFTIWSKPAFPTCLYGSILLNNRCSLDRSFSSEILCHYKIKCWDESQSFSVHSRSSIIFHFD